MSRYKINVMTLKGEFLTYHVSEYKIIDGFVVFTDEKIGKEKKFPVSRVEIEEEKNG
jgi:hypothetical protein